MCAGKYGTFQDPHFFAPARPSCRIRCQSSSSQGSHRRRRFELKRERVESAVERAPSQNLTIVVNKVTRESCTKWPNTSSVRTWPPLRLPPCGRGPPTGRFKRLLNLEKGPTQRSARAPPCRSCLRTYQSTIVARRLLESLSVSRLRDLILAL